MCASAEAETPGGPRVSSLATSTQGRSPGPIPSSSRVCKHDQQKTPEMWAWSGFPAGSEGKEPACHAGDGSIPGLGEELQAQSLPLNFCLAAWDGLSPQAFAGAKRYDLCTEPEAEARVTGGSCWSPVALHSAWQPGLQGSTMDMAGGARRCVWMSCWLLWVPLTRCFSPSLPPTLFTVPATFLRSPWPLAI